jgi:hypothetical protein
VAAVFAAAALPLLSLSACVAPSDTAGAGNSAPVNPRYASYRCDGDSEITIENFGTSLHVVDTRGVDVELPASPPAQSSRYGQPGYALLLERGTALWMVSGKPPVNCRREAGTAG